LKRRHFFKRTRERLQVFFSQKEEASLSNRFINGIELVYSLILACAVVKMVDVFHGDILDVLGKSWHTLLISCLFLLRFFFAPAQNLKALSKHARGWKWTIMPFDGLALFGIAIFFYYMCLNIKDPEIFYRTFFYLLYFDIIWLLTIALRCRTDCVRYNKVWIYNNALFVLLYLILTPLWQVWFALALTNSLIDFGLTYSDYFTPS
jgi:hypothetical protein